MNPIKILFILFSLFTIHYSLFAKDALPILVDGGEPFENRDNFYIPNRSPINAIAISQDGKTIISGSDDNTIKIWNRATGALEQTLEGHKSSVNSVAISNDGKNIISGSNDGSVCLWSIKESKEPLKEFVAGRGDSWVVFVRDSSKNFFLRGDDGTLFYKKDGAKLKLVLPKLPIKDNLTLSSHEDIKMVSQKLYHYNVTVKNKAKNPLYWIKSSYHDRYCTITKQRLSNIEANQEENLTLKLYCKLPRENPKPIINHKINLELITATKEKHLIPLSVNIGYAHLEVAKTEVSEDEKTLNVLLKNSGTENLEKAQVQLLEPFVSNPQTISQVEANGTEAIAFSLEGRELENNATLSMKIYIPNEAFRNAMPLYEWHSTNIRIDFNKMAWYLYALWMLGAVAFVLSALYYKRYKNPLVLKLSQDPSKLLGLEIEQLEEAQKRLSIIDRWESILIYNAISQERYSQAVAFGSMSQQQKVDHLNRRIFANSTAIGSQSFLMTLKDDFPLNVKKFILFFSDKESVDDMMSDIKAIPQYRSHILLILSSSSQKQLRLYEQSDRVEKLVLPHPTEITRLLLESDGSKVLADIFASQLSLTQISPYQLGGGVKSSMFFGRAKIVSHILGRDNSNYIIIGSRQIGKSSLLKAIEREYQKSHEEVYYISLNAGDLVKGVAKALGLKAKTLDEIVNYLLQSDRPYLFLIDEADKFVQYEKAQDYETLNALRKLSEEGRANFILAGFWELYQHAVLDYQSPLKNFGETIELGALEREACEAMIREPMSQLGLTIEQNVIEHLINQAGERANLIAIVCHNIIKNLGKTKKEITLNDAKEALKEENVSELFESWRELNDDSRANRLDRIVVYATVKEGRFTLESLLDNLKERGLVVDIAQIEKSLDRLKVSYTIERNSEGEYLYRVALFREYILRGEYEVKLRGEIEGW